jgi:hypothetical protein
MVRLEKKKLNQSNIEGENQKKNINLRNSKNKDK